MRLSLEVLQALAILMDVRERLDALADDDDLEDKCIVASIPLDDQRDGWPAYWAAKEIDKAIQLLSLPAATPAPLEEKTAHD